MANIVGKSWNSHKIGGLFGKSIYSTRRSYFIELHKGKIIDGKAIAKVYMKNLKNRIQLLQTSK